jgi:hypothetical protein
MIENSAKPGSLSRILSYFGDFSNLSPKWRGTAAALGIALVAVLCIGVLIAVPALYSVFGGGTVRYDAVGSPGPVVFSHYTHMWFENGKYKECKACHDKLFATDKYGTFVLRALKNSPKTKVHISRDADTLYVPGTPVEDELALVTYQVPRACATCATGACHDGKESFGRLDCLGCHQRK